MKNTFYKHVFIWIPLIGLMVISSDKLLNKVFDDKIYILPYMLGGYQGCWLIFTLWLISLIN